MKKSMIITLIAALSCVAPMAAQGYQENLKNILEPYGFLRTYAIFDTRDSKAGSEDLFYYLPLDTSLNLEGQDIYSNPSFKMYAVTTRLGVNLKGFQYGLMKVTGKVETDFYLMNGTTASLRLREAYVNMLWDGLGYMENQFSVKVGQAWHPMSADMPYCVNTETGSPFNPFNWSPQVMLTFGLSNGLSITGGALYPMQFLPTGPSGESEDYVKYGMVPELYGGISYEGHGFTARAGADILTLRPRWRTTDYSFTEDIFYDVGSRVNDRLSMVSPFVFLQYEGGMFKVNAKSVLASGGDHLRLMGGYALYDWRDPFNYVYTPIRSSSSFISFCVGKQLQFMCMGGYMMTLGTQHNLPVKENGYCDPTDIYYFSGGTRDVNRMFRVTPTIAYTVGKLTVALEYDNTTVEYGNVGKLDNYARPVEDLHMITNHRLLGVVRYNL